ncbi:MAG TPA: VIT1/CCC1 transporter family protein, partial [Candidatus Limnocylindrales bacterium]
WGSHGGLMTAIDDPRQSLENLKLERDAIVLYDALAEIEKEQRRAAAFHRIAGNERRHADIWAGKLRELGVDVPPPGPPRMRIRAIVALARVFGTHAVSDLVQALEGDEEEIYTGQETSPEVESIAADEREHAEIWRELDAGRASRFGSIAPRDAQDMKAVHEAAAAPAAQGFDLEEGTVEPWHRAGQSGTLRAVIFGVSDGLVSNTSLVMGVAGAASGDPKFILLAGIAGLLAGSFSMAAGEYISMQSQRELFERQIHLEREELKAMPEEEESELARIYRTKGFTADEARSIAHRLFQKPEMALDTLVREELGLDPDELGNPWRAAIGSLLAFGAGAAVPVVPFLFGGGAAVFAASIVLSLVAMFTVGGAVSLLTGRSFLFSGARQVVIGVVAATVTFAVGRLIGVNVS